MTYYNLPNINSDLGVFVIRVGSEFAGLTPPICQTIKDVAVETSADRLAGRQQVGLLTLILQDDYSTYDAGFWYKILSGDSDIRVYLVENGTNTFSFYGKPEQRNIKELALNTERYPYLREPEVVYRSSFATLIESEIDDFADAMLANITEVGKFSSFDYDGVTTLLGLFAALLNSSGLNPSYNINDVSFVYDEQDFKYLDEANTEYRFDELLIPITAEVESVPHQPNTFWNSGHEDYVGKYYGTLKEFLRDLALSFGFFVSMDYDVSTNRHKIKLIQRRRAYSTPLVFARQPKESVITDANEIKIDGVKATLLRDDEFFAFESYRYGNVYLPPENYSFDIDFRVPYERYYAGWPGDSWQLFTPDFEFVHEVQYFNHDDQTWHGNGSQFSVMIAAVGYIYSYHPLGDDPLRQQKIIRRYAGITANIGGGETHTIVDIMRPTVIDDGLGEATYFANKVTKELNAAECEIEWIREPT